MRPVFNNKPQPRRSMGLNARQVQSYEKPQAKRDLRPTTRQQLKDFQDTFKPMMGHLGGGLGDSIGNPSSEPCMVLSEASAITAIASDPATNRLYVANGNAIDGLERRDAFWYRVSTYDAGAPVVGVSAYAKRLIYSTATETAYVSESGAKTLLAGASNDVLAYSVFGDSYPDWPGTVVADYVGIDGRFPNDFAVTCNDISVTVWDVTGAPSVYMVFDVGAGLMLAAGVPSCLAYREGWLFVGSNDAVRIIDFFADESITADPARYAIRTNKTIAERNTGGTLDWENISDAVLVATPVNDVEAALLDGSPRRSGTNLRIPDWVAATDGGISQARPDGLIWDVTGFVATNAYVDISQAGTLLFGNGANLAYTYPSLTQDEVVGTNFTSRYYGTDQIATEPNAPKILTDNFAGVFVAEDVAFGDAVDGVTVIDESPDYINSVGSFITDVYNTGPMLNVIGAYLCGPVGVQGPLELRNPITISVTDTTALVQVTTNRIG